jgi:glycosyltransferase involved in cell wall biosynthesis
MPESHEQKLSVIVPVYNEAATVETLVERLRCLDLPLEIIAVDDAFTDGAGTSCARSERPGESRC